MQTIADLDHTGVHIRSLTDGVDTSTPGGRLVAGLFSVLAEYERGLIRERTTAGLAAARATGICVGRPPGRRRQQTHRQHPMAADGLSHHAISNDIGVSKSTGGRTRRNADTGSGSA